MKGQMTGFASWDKIKEVVKLVQPKVPVLANGGVPGSSEVEPCLEETGANGLMSAEGNLYNPMMFNPSNALQGIEYTSKLPQDMREAVARCDQELEGSWDRQRVAYAPAPYLAAQYLSIVLTIPNNTQTSPSAIKAHLYKMLRPVWAEGRHLEMREKLGKAGQKGLEYREKVEEYVRWTEEFTRLIKVCSLSHIRRYQGSILIAKQLLLGGLESVVVTSRFLSTAHSRRSRHSILWESTLLALPTVLASQ